MWRLDVNSRNELARVQPVGYSLEATRRTFLGRSLLGMGGIALATMLGKSGSARGNAPAAASTTSPTLPGAVHALHHTPRVKRVIFLCMAGGPSHLETLDYKPKLAAMHGQPMPESFTQGQPIAQLQGQTLTC